MTSAPVTSVATIGVPTIDPSDIRADAEVTVTGRGVEIPDHYRAHVGQKLSRLECLDRGIQRFEVVLRHERNRRQRKSCQHVEITARGRGPVVRGEARADSFYAAFEAALSRVQTRLRRAKDRRTVHYGDKTPTSLAEATAVPVPTAADAAVDTAADAAVDASAAFDPPSAGAPASVDDAGTDAAEMSGPGRVVRVKDHPARPQSVDDALNAMELVGHDFYLFHDAETGRPSVVYRRHAFDYGLIRLTESTG